MGESESDAVFIPSQCCEIDTFRPPKRSSSSPLIIDKSNVAPLTLDFSKIKIKPKREPKQELDLKPKPESEPKPNKKERERSIFFVEPYDESYNDGKRVNHLALGEFLKCCNACHKEFEPKKPIYMFRNLEAFCTDECRTKYIEVEEPRLIIREGESIDEEQLLRLMAI